MGPEPCSIELPDQPMDCTISCIDPLVATGLVSGQILIHRYSTEPSADSAQSITSEEVLCRESKKGASCRALSFSADGSSLFAGFETGALLQLDAATGKATQRIPKAHSVPVNRLLALVNQPQLVAVGDNNGGLKLWDLRSKEAAWSYSKHSDTITGLTTDPKESCLLTVSGDGTLSVHDLRSSKALARSEDDADDELLSVVVVKHGKKVVCGAQSGVLSIFSWGYWNDCSDRFPGHPESVDAIVKFDEDTIITGSSDGALRVLSVLPNKLLGVVGEHADLPLEKLVLSGDHRVLASTSHDNTVKLWDLSCLHDDGDGEEEEEEEEQQQQDEVGQEREMGVAGTSDGVQGRHQEGTSSSGRKQEGMSWVDMVLQNRMGGGEVGAEGKGADSDGDDLGTEDSSDDEDGGRQKKKRKREKTAMTKGRNKPKKDSNFFADLL